MPPIKVDILRTDPVRFAVGEKSQVRCQTYGSRPPAIITWWKDDVRLPVSSREVSVKTTIPRGVLGLHRK